MYFESHEDISVAAIAVKYFGTRDGEQLLKLALSGNGCCGH